MDRRDHATSAMTGVFDDSRQDPPQPKPMRACAVIATVAVLASLGALLVTWISG